MSKGDKKSALSVLVAVDGASLNEGLKRNAHLDGADNRLKIDYTLLREFLEDADRVGETKIDAVSRYYISSAVLDSNEMEQLEKWVQMWRAEEVDRLKGTVTRFGMDGYGFIRGDNGVDYFAHYSEIENAPVRGLDFKTLHPGDKVSFIPKLVERGRTATHVRSSLSLLHLQRQLFYKIVRDADFQIIETRADPRTPRKCKSVDIRIILDAFKLPKGSEFVLVSDDPDLVPLIEALKVRRKIRVAVAAFSDKFPKELQDVADEVIRLDKNLDQFILEPKGEDAYDDDEDEDEEDEAMVASEA